MSSEGYLLTGTIVGGLLGWGGHVISQRLKTRQRRSAMAGAFTGEITTTLNIIRDRHYPERLREALSRQEQDPPESPNRMLFWSMRREWFPVFNSNINEIGLFNHPLPENLVRFYSQAYSVIEDVRDMQEEQEGKKSPYSREDHIGRLRESIAFIEDNMRLATILLTDLQRERNSWF